ncbi:hypothetical protein B0181_08990 [Moraxella caviae]|uniref:Uncharacterized protein n=1 Tax=Moraxella caviae TaxID=34060 RepID=A0A1S9ZXF2_9GAMM|nr:hypothetical protein [Moraxella caviae]OOR88077.1 hypothetical protein B0181_08990 [Moraxella caviae]STZ09980.1 Uncharacterised protein [Moraxella caviae]
MFGVSVLQSDYFTKDMGSFGSIFVFGDKQTGKNQQYNLEKDVQSFQCVDVQEVETLMGDVQTGVIGLTAGTAFFGAGLLPALGVLWLGGLLPDRMTNNYVLQIIFKDGKSAILRASERKYRKLKPYFTK